MNVIDISYSDPLLIATFKNELNENSIPFECADKLVGVYQESFCSFEFSNNNDFNQADKILENLKSTKAQKKSDKQNTKGVFSILRSKGVNAALIIGPIILLTLLLYRMISQLINGSMMKIAWVGVIALIAFILLLILMLMRTIKE
jgi:hypothetical protein